MTKSFMRIRPSGQRATDITTVTGEIFMIVCTIEISLEAMLESELVLAILRTISGLGQSRKKAFGIKP